MSTLAHRVENVRHEARRVVQTRSTFRNWPELLKDMAGARVGRGAEELTFRTKIGPALTCPNIPGARLPIYEQFADDCYRLRWLLGPLAGRPLQVIDVGAHIGSFATNIGSLNPGTDVQCYEPSARSAEYLRRNLAQNGMADRSTVHELALSDSDGPVMFDDNSGGSVHNGLIRDDARLVDGDDAVAERHAVQVMATTFAQAVRNAPRPPDVVKLDCEGGEYPLVRASSPDDWASVQRIVLEHHPVRGEHWADLRAWFLAAGFTVLRDDVNGPELGTAWLSRT